MRGFGDQNKIKKKHKKNDKKTQPSKEQIISKAFQFHSEGNIPEAAKYYKYFINQGFKDERVFLNYGMILKELGKLQEAKLFTCQAIEINPNFVQAHYNLGIILKELGKLQEAEISYRKVIDMKSDYADAHYNLGNLLRELGNLKKAESSTRQAIEINPNFAEAHCNLGSILKDLGKLQEAESSTRQAIEINPYLAEAHCNLGNIFKNLGKLQEAEISYRKAVKINPHYALAYFYLSMLRYSNKDNNWKNQLFSETILNSKLQKDCVSIYFARANILHKEKNYEGSSQYLELANKLKLTLNPSEVDTLINKSKRLLFESNKQEIDKKENKKLPQSIFIVGMPRSGSTLLETILNMNSSIIALGESNILEETSLDNKKISGFLTLAERYWSKIKEREKKLNKTTNKNLYNYLYVGFIANQIPNAKIIHCFRNPLDNILSMYRAYFDRGNNYSSSLVDSARAYLNQEEIMTEYKNRFRSKIYDLNYDSLVNSPNKEIKSLITWLGWNWNELYLSPHLNPRSVSTASSVEVRSPINSNSIGGWKNYAELLKPVLEIITQNSKYKNLKY